MNPAPVLVARITRAFVPAILSLSAVLVFAGPPIVEDARSPYPPHDLADGASPPVQIACPTPSPDTALFAPPTLHIFWDRPHAGPHSPRPFEYRYILLGPSSEFPVDLAVNDPASFRDYYANHPLGPWTGWESTADQTSSVELRNLIPNVEYLFAVIALDREGGYSPEFSLSTNMLHLAVGFPVPGSPVSWAPVLTMSGPGFKHRYPQGGYCVCDSAEIRTEMRLDQISTFRWSAEPGFLCQSPPVRWYRWALDIEDVSDETPRFPEETDLRHWSQKSPEPGSARLGPFTPGEVHRLFVEAEDLAGLVPVVPAARLALAGGVVEAPGGAPWIFVGPHVGDGAFQPRPVVVVQGQVGGQFVGGPAGYLHPAAFDRDPDPGHELHLDRAVRIVHLI